MNELNQDNLDTHAAKMSEVRDYAKNMVNSISPGLSHEQSERARRIADSMITAVNSHKEHDSEVIFVGVMIAFTGMTNTFVKTLTDSYCSFCAEEGNPHGIADDQCNKCKKNVCFDHCSSDKVCFDCIDKMNPT